MHVKNSTFGQGRTVRNTRERKQPLQGTGPPSGVGGKGLDGHCGSGTLSVLSGAENSNPICHSQLCTPHPPPLPPSHCVERLLIQPGTQRTGAKPEERGLSGSDPPFSNRNWVSNLKHGLNSPCICLFFPSQIGSLGKAGSLRFERERESYIYPKEKLSMLALQTAHSSPDGRRELQERGRFLRK